MNDLDTQAVLIERLLELDETSVLSLVEQRLQQGENPLRLLEDSQEGMRQVGLRYEERQYYLSGLMMAGEIFRQVMERLEPVLVECLTGNESGHILLGTVQGDIHDIGKNIFALMLGCHGFTVTDLGVDVPPGYFVDMALQLRPDIVGLSGLLTVSYDAMRDTVGLLRRSGNAHLTRLPVIIGGGLLNAQVCTYTGANYWSVDAMLGVTLCQQIVADRRGPDPLPTRT